MPPKFVPKAPEELVDLDPETLRAEVQTAYNEIAKQRKLRDEWKEKIKAIMEQERAELAALRPLKGRVAELEETNSSLQRDCAEAKGELQKLQKVVEEQKSTVEEMRQAQLNAANLRLQIKESGMDAQALADRVVHLEGQVERLAKELQAKELELEELRTLATNKGEGRSSEGMERQLREELDQARAELANMTQDFERFKERTNMAMKMRGRELNTERTKQTAVEEELRQVLQELEHVKEESEQRRQDILSLEHQAAQASMETARELEVSQSVAEKVKRQADTERLTLVSQHREEMTKMRDRYESRIQEIQSVHEMEVERMQNMVEEVEGKARLAVQEKIDKLIAENVELQGRLDQLQTENMSLARSQKDLHHSVSRSASNGDMNDEGARKELEAKVRRLKEENEYQSQKLWGLQNELLELKNASGSLNFKKYDEPKQPTSISDFKLSQEQGYLRGVLVNFLTANDDSVRGNLIPVLTTLLQLTPSDLRNIYKSNPAWAM